MSRDHTKRKLRANEVSTLIKREAYAMRIAAAEEHGGVSSHEYVASVEYKIAQAFDNLADRLVGLR